MINLHDLGVNFASKAHNERINMLKCYVISHLTPALYFPFLWASLRSTFQVQVEIRMPLNLSFLDQITSAPLVLSASSL